MFERTTRSVTATAAGNVLLGEARRLFAQSQAMQRAVRRVHESHAGTLRVGFISTAFLGVIQPRFPRLTARLGAVEYVWSEMTSPQQVEALRNMELDLGFVHTPLEHKGLHDKLLLEECFVLAICDTHRLAKRKSVRLAELADEAFVFFPREIAPGYHDMMLAACAAAGFSPDVRHEARHFLALLMLPASGCGVSVVPASARRLSLPGLRIVPIRDRGLRAELKMLWNPQNRAPMLLRALEQTRTDPNSAWP